jgi:tape measure domain-containing protein
MVKRLNEFAAKTPYEIEGISSAARQLLASGTDIEQVTEQLQYLGDIAASQGVPIEEIAAIFSKVQAKGKVELESLNQLAERGIPIFKALSEATGLPADALGAGAVSVEEFTATLRGMAQEGGMAYMAMDNLSQTAAGKFSTAMDSLKMAAASIGELLLPYITAAIDKVTEMADKFQALDEGTKKMILTIAGVVAAIGPLVMGFSAATKAYKAFTGANEMIIKLFPKLSAAMAANPVGRFPDAILGQIRRQHHGDH